jgi:hypothetical protein
MHLDLLEALPRRGTQRRAVMDFVRSLALDPFKQGDCTDQDDSRRTRQIKIIGDYAVTYWTDHPAKSVMVVDIRSADR